MCINLYSPNIVDVVTKNMTILVSTVSLDLTYFTSKFIEDGFITQTATHAVLSKLGISDEEKARQLLYVINKNHELLSLDKQEWAERFITAFSSQAAYNDVATTLSRSMFHLYESLYNINYGMYA